MYNFISEFEYLQIELEEIASMTLAISDAMSNLPNSAEAYAGGVDLLLRLLRAQTKKMQEIINRASQEGGVANE